MVQLTIDLPNDQVVLSDFDLFHFCLMFCFLPSDERQERMFEEACFKERIRESDLQLGDLQSPALSRLRQQAEQSWQKIFDLSFWNAPLFTGIPVDEPFRRHFGSCGLNRCAKCRNSLPAKELAFLQ